MKILVDTYIYIALTSYDGVCSSVVFAFLSSVTTFRICTVVTPCIVTHLVTGYGPSTLPLRYPGSIKT